MVTVALDASADDARPWIEAARPTHPSLVDSRHVLADLYNVVNVPTIFWIDERGRIVRPNDVAFGADTFKHTTGLESARHLTALRAWVRGEGPALSAEEVRRHQPLPTEEHQRARAEFGLGQWLWAQGRPAAAERHFVRGGVNNLLAGFWRLERHCRDRHSPPPLSFLRGLSFRLHRGSCAFHKPT